VWITAAALAVIGIALGVFFGKVLPDRRAARADREGAAVSDFDTLVVQKFPPGQSQQVPPDTYKVFPTLAQTLTKLPTTDPKDATTTAKGFHDAAIKSSDDIAAIDVQKLIPVEFTQDRLDLVEARFDMSQALKLYGTVGDLMSAAVKAPKDQQAAFIAQAQAVAGEADILFSHGYQKIVNIKVRLGIQSFIQPTAAPPVTAVPTTAAPSPTSTKKKG